MLVSLDLGATPRSPDFRARTDHSVQSTSLGKTVAFPLIVLTWIVSVACLGVCGRMLSKYGQVEEGPGALFPAYQSASILILLTIASVFDMVFGCGYC